MANSVDPDQSSLFWVHAVCFYTQFVSNIRQLFSADDFSRRHFQMHFFLGALTPSLPYSKCSFGGKIASHYMYTSVVREEYFMV